jgi:hypothetical protein
MKKAVFTVMVTVLAAAFFMVGNSFAEDREQAAQEKIIKPEGGCSSGTGTCVLSYDPSDASVSGMGGCGGGYCMTSCGSGSGPSGQVSRSGYYSRTYSFGQVCAGGYYERSVSLQKNTTTSVGCK